MSDGLGKLFKNNKQTTVVSKYLSQTSADQIGDGIESAGHLSESVKKRDAYLPAIDYSEPKNFVRFGSAEKYYADAFLYVAGYYPYDGSGYEKTKFFNDLNPLETYLFEEEYPRSTGYVLFNPSWGTRTALTDGYGFASATPSEYIQTKGGPHSGNLYSVPDYRTSNLEFGGPSGSTVEFFYNKATGMPDNSLQGDKQVIFDLWNGVVSSSAGHGRLRIEIFSGSEDRFHVTLLSGTTGFFTQSVPTTGGLSDLCSGSWHYYSFALNTSTFGDISSYVPTIDFYVDGVCVETAITASGRDATGHQGHTDGGIGVVTGSLISNLGSLRAAPSGSLEGTTTSELDLEGYGKLSASVDEFRFWKSCRNPEEVGRYWFTQVDGGSNKYSANKDLGVYFKFNEGITETVAIDSVVLDYSGRISNGNFVAYAPAYSRNTGSAVDSMQLNSVYETKDPIIRKTNPLYTSKLDELQISGSVYDVNNNGRLVDKIPDWIVEEDTQLSGELTDMVQILSTYFDTLRLQISQINQLKNLEYISGSLTGSAKAFPHNDRVLDNFGLETPEIFENIGALSQFLKRDEQINFDQELVNTKNLIYKNVYNNLITIYKQKGTPQSIRNFVRCLGVGDEIISLNTYANNSEYFLTSSYKGLSSTKKYVDFSGLTSTTDNQAVVYQYYDNSNPNSYGLINGSGASTDLDEFAFTLEAEFIFPDRSNIEALSFVPYYPITSSLFGFHTPDDTSPTSTDLTWAAAVSDYGLRVIAVKSPGAFAKVTSPPEKVNDVYFAVVDRSDTVLLTSDVYSQVYDNQKWNLALRLKPKKYPFAEQVRGTTFAGGAALEYDLELYGVNYTNGKKQNYFSLSTDFTYTKGAATLNSAKRIFLGAHRTNFDGSLLTHSDVRASSCRYWSNYLTDENIDLHAKESFSFGTIHPYQNSYSFQSEKPNVFIPEIQTLALNWDFANLSGSDASGQFTVSDFSSGSVSGYPSSYQDNVDATFSDINLRQHTGRGDLFDASATVIKKEYIYTEKKQVPDYATSSEMIKVLASDEKYFNINYRPENLFFAVEKSMYKNISERMLQLFASIEEFNNLIGPPVNKYRQEYKDLEKMREIFFRNVEGSPDFDKYLRFYKWLDVSMGEMIQQLMPASVAKAENVRTIVENHMLERPKIKYAYPGAYKTRTPNVAGTVRNLGSICPDQPGWKFNHAPLNTDDSHPRQDDNCYWWKTRTGRANGQFGPLSEGALVTREAIFTQVQSNFTSSQIVCLSADLKTPIIGGINQPLNKYRRITDVTFSAFKEGKDCNDEFLPNQKVRLTYKGVKDGTSYKGELVSPFTLLSSSTNLNGHQVQLGEYGTGETVNITLTNLHEDSVHPFGHSVPVQGPFTRTHVGGTQARHVNLFAVSGSKRRESNRLSIGTSQIDINAVTVGLNEGAEVPKGQYLRGATAKAFVNIRNIRTLTGSYYGHGTAPSSHNEQEGVVPVGNFKLNYQVLQTNDRAATNIDFIFNTSHYFTGSIPTAFLTTPAMRNTGFGRTGSLDYEAPRQIASRRTTESVFVNRFAAPGSTLDSRQQFRDVPSDQLSPNNALPFRNIPVRKTYNTEMKNYTGWGGFITSSGQNILEAEGGNILYKLNEGIPPYNGHAAKHKTQRNTIQRLAITAAEVGAGEGVTVGTGSLRNNDFYSSPIPAGDRTNWFMNLSGADAPGQSMMSEFILSSSHYPLNIIISTSSLGLNEASFYGPPPAAAIMDTLGPFGAGTYIWNRGNTRPGFVPWTQTRQQYSQFGNYYVKNNRYDFYLDAPELSLDERVVYGNSSYGDAGTPTSSFSLTDRAGNSISYHPLKRFKEPPVTSRYKPLFHNIKSYIGTPAKSAYDDPVETNVKYSYGNYLMGFANRGINSELTFGGSTRWGTGRVKRPYEAFRDNYLSKLPSTVDGINIIRLTNYSETVYPREIYTYLSASRARMSFENSFWKKDRTVDLSTFSTNINSIAAIGNDAYIHRYARNIERIQTPFTTSQGYVVLRSEQLSYDTVTGGTEGAGPGSGSLWPMDSYIYAALTSSLDAVQDSGGFEVGLAAASTLPCGELMMTSHGEVKTDSSSPSSVYQRGNAISAQYIYTSPTMDRACTSVAGSPAVATIESLIPPTDAIAATLLITVSPTWTDTCLDAGVLTLDDTGTACDITFDKNTDQTPSACPGILGYDEVAAPPITVSTIATKIANGINTVYSTNFTAVANTPDPGDVTVTANTAGTVGNGYSIYWTSPGGACAATDIIIQDGVTTYFTGGAAAVSIHNETITMQWDDGSGGTGTQTMTFKQDATPSSATIIDVSYIAPATGLTVDEVAAAIATTISTAATTTSVDVSAVITDTVHLESATTGTHQNGKVIAGSADAAGIISPTSFGGGAAPTVACIYDVLPKSPGGYASRPPWSANTERRAVEGPYRGGLLAGRDPFYNSYDDYDKDVRLKGQEYTIVPEYRMSVNLEQYENNGTPFSLVSRTLSLTGANSTVYDTSNPEFFGRYLNSDKMEYLDPFMETTTSDFRFNKFPKHLKLESKAIVKLLPYDGFYPMDRSLQIASLFSSSYSFTFSGASGSTTQAMRSLLRPFYAPGIFYNSIKSGISVDYPLRRVGRNEDQFIEKSSFDILGGALSGSLTVPSPGQIPGNAAIPNPERRRFNGNNPLTVGQAPIDFDLDNTNEFYWADRLPFESIFRPEDYIYSWSRGKITDETVLSDLNEVLFNDVTGSISAIQNNFYKKAISNFLAVTPEFFLKMKTNKNGSDGHMTKFVGVLGSNGELIEQAGLNFGGALPETPPITPPSNPRESRIYATMDNVYIMEVGLTKTDKFNMYNNPYAFGIPTATGSGEWQDYSHDGPSGAERPSGSDWPKHRGEFAPFTPPYFYGTSVARITFVPPESREYSLDEIVGRNATNTQIEFINESGSYYDFSLDTYIDINLTEQSTIGTPPYGWNRAWQNRMDIDASLCLTNVFPLENGRASPAASGKWVIMPKWECPILDFPNYGSTRSDGNIYSFSSSVQPGEFDGAEAGTYGMWHQYGVMPKEGQGVYMYIKDVSMKETELRLVGDPSLGAGSATGQQIQVYKVPKSVTDSGKNIASLADLAGFDPEEVMRGGFDVRKAKRLGEVAEDGEKQVSEAILAMPYWVDKDSKPRFMTLQGPHTELGPKIKEFRRNFTKYSLPPTLATYLAALLPKTYPEIPNIINPFGVDELDATLASIRLTGANSLKTPVVYLLEHGVSFSRQDLADIWQGILPDIGTSLRVDVSAIDHYVRVPETYQTGQGLDTQPNLNPQFPEILKKQLDLGVERTGIPRYDLLNISNNPNNSSDGLNVEIKWLVFKVKQRGTKSYDKMMLKELNGPLYDPYKASLERDNPAFEQLEAAFAAVSYFDNNAVGDPTYNWPYDYMSLVEMDKITVSAGFRPDIDKEIEELLPPVPEQNPPILPPGGAEFRDARIDTQNTLQRTLGQLPDDQTDEVVPPPPLNSPRVRQRDFGLGSGTNLPALGANPGAGNNNDEE